MARITGINKATISLRLNKGLSVGQALGYEESDHISTYKKLIEYNGETHSMHEWARITGIKYETIYSRIKKGWPIGQALGYDIKGRMLEYNGEAHYAAEWARITGINKATISLRLKNDWPINEVLGFKEHYSRNKRHITYNGEIHNICEWARITGIHFHTIWARLKNGWPIGQALGYEERMR